MNLNLDFSLTRRRLLKIFTSGALFLLGAKGRPGKAASFSSLNMAEGESRPGKSRVVLCRHEQALDASGKPRASLVRFMLDEALKKLADTDDISFAWRRFIPNDDVIGMKVNAMSYPTTHPQLTYAVSDSLVAAGYTANKIIIWGQVEKGLIKAGYPLNQSDRGVGCYATDSIGKIFSKSPYRLRYDFFPVSYGAARSRLSKIFSKRCSTIINLPILKDHYIAGVTSSMKNLLGGIDNPKHYHPNHGDPYLADLNCIPQINRKLKLNIVDMLKPLYHGGPSGHPRHQWPFKGIMVGTDRVALDYLGWQIIEEKRKEMEMRSLAEEGRRPGYIETAAKNGLGTANPADIELIELNFS